MDSHPVLSIQGNPAISEVVVHRSHLDLLGNSPRSLEIVQLQRSSHKVDSSSLKARSFFLLAPCTGGKVNRERLKNPKSALAQVSIVSQNQRLELGRLQMQEGGGERKKTPPEFPASEKGDFSINKMSSTSDTQSEDCFPFISD